MPFPFMHRIQLLGSVRPDVSGSKVAGMHGGRLKTGLAARHGDALQTIHESGGQ